MFRVPGNWFSRMLCEFSPPKLRVEMKPVFRQVTEFDNTSGIPPSTSNSHHQDYEPFLVGNPKLNLYLPLLLGVPNNTCFFSIEYLQLSYFALLANLFFSTYGDETYLVGKISKPFKLFFSGSFRTAKVSYTLELPPTQQQ